MARVKLLMLDDFPPPQPLCCRCEDRGWYSRETEARRWRHYVCTCVSGQRLLGPHPQVNTTEHEVHDAP